MSKPVNATLRDIVAVTPDDDATLENKYGELPNHIIIATTVGAVAVVTGDGQTITLPAGMFTLGDRFPLTVKKILETGTTAVGIYVGYGVG